MKRVILFFIFLLLKNSPAHADPINILFKKLNQAQPYTFFCHLPISSKGKVKFQACGYCPIEEVPVVAMPIVPNEFLAKNLPCYQHKVCTKKNSYLYKGLSCCKKIDVFYQQMSQDLHNLVPEIRQIKQLRGQHNPTALPNISPAIGCHELSVDKKRHLIHIPEAQRGAIARIYLYMADTYQLKLEPELRTMLESWHKLYEVTDWERKRNRLIYNEQGTCNRRIELLYYSHERKK